MAKQRKRLVRGEDWHYWAIKTATGEYIPQLHHTRKEARFDMATGEGETLVRVKLAEVT